LKSYCHQDGVENLNRLSFGTQKIQSAAGWKSLLAAYSRIVTINGIILLALGLLLDRFLIPYFNTIQINESVKAFAVPAISLAAGAPLFGLLWRESQIIRTIRIYG
jgi:hypothetical protein